MPTVAEIEATFWPVRWSRVAAEVAQAVGADPGDVRRALEAAIEADRAER